SWKTGPCSWWPTACPPCAKPTASWSWTAAPSSKKATTKCFYGKTDITKNFTRSRLTADELPNLLVRFRFYRDARGLVHTPVERKLVAVEHLAHPRFRFGSAAWRFLHAHPSRGKPP